MVRTYKTGTYKADGTITVFLSMVLLITISLIMTTVESLRVYNMSVYSQRALYTALDSVLAEYYYPLFKEYHVFGLDGSYGSDSIKEGHIENEIKEYIDYTFNPSQEMPLGGFNLLKSNLNMMDINTDKVELTDFKTLMDYEGELFRSQAIDYTKYSLAGEGLEAILEKLNVIKESDIKGMEIIPGVLEQKLETEKSVSQVIEDIMILSESLDGININPINLINQGITYLDSLIKNDEIRYKAEITFKFKSLIDQSEIEDKEELKKLIDEIKDAEEEIEECNNNEKTLLGDFKNNMDEVENLVNSIYPKLETSINTIDTLITNQSKLKDTLNDYKIVLEGNKTRFSDDLYSNLWTDYKKIEDYSHNGGENRSYDFPAMKAALGENQNILKEVKDNLNIKLTSNKDTWQTGREELNKIKTSFSKYSNEDFQLDYQKVEEEESDTDIFVGINDIISKGLFELLLPETATISEKNIGQAYTSNLPSNLYNTGEDALINLETLNMDNIFEIFGGISQSFTEDFNLDSLVLSSSDDLLAPIIYQKYLLDHFARYEDEAKVDMPTLLDYEIEYILKGQGSDYDNLTSILYNLIIYRTLMNTVSLLTNIESNEEAGRLARSLVGFLGQPVLITVTKTIILITWAFAESLIDVSALLQEKSIPIYKKFTDFHLELEELPFINRNLINEKISKIKNNDSILYFDYTDYLNLFLLMKSEDIKTYRALDLIQINIQNNYEDTFLISNCLYGIQVSADFSMDEKFISLPFVRNIIGGSGGGYFYNTINTYSY